MLFRDGDAEKQGKGDEDASAAAPAEAPQAAPQVPITTPPPPVTDMSGHSTYGGYGSWYQVGRYLECFKKRKMPTDLAVLHNLRFVHFQQPQYGSYGYQNTWNYNQGYYPSS